MKKTKRILICEISGKRPGDNKKRPTEKMKTRHDKVIISNNSEGYITDWPLINVPDDFRKWYIENHKNSDNAWYAPMNRTYAIKWAREHGYDYLLQLDDNITRLDISQRHVKNGRTERIRMYNIDLDDYIDMFEVVLENTNAALVGCNLASYGAEGNVLIREGYCYSIFMLDLSVCPSIFHGDFEDDIEYRYKCKQMGLPTVMIPSFTYSKTSQMGSKDSTGCRAEYIKQGIKRGSHMSLLYNDMYSARMTNHSHSTAVGNTDDGAVFKHIIKPFRVGIVIYNIEPIKETYKMILRKNKKTVRDSVQTKVINKQQK